MMYWIKLATQSALSRRASLLIIIFSTSISVTILIAVFKIRDDTKTSFTNAISGVDLVVGSKASPTELILHSIFHIGRPTSLVAGNAIKEIKSISQVKWLVPIQLGDSYRSYPVIGTTTEFFQHIRAQNKALAFSSGISFEDSNKREVVLGANVARKFKHQLTDQVFLSHGSGTGPAQDHSDSPFTISGILKANGTPIDNSIFISAQSFNGLHDGSDGKIQFAQLSTSQYSAFFLGLTQRSSIFSVRRQIDSLKSPPLMAVMPGVALDDLWQTLEVAENALLLVSVGVILTSILGIAATLLISLESRRRELATLRVVGVKPIQIFFLIILESLLIISTGIILGWLFLQVLVFAFSDWLMKEWGILSTVGLPSANDLIGLLMILIAALICSIIPGIKAYRLALHDGLNPPNI
jgi:putative ABC transport system permease protein